MRERAERVLEEILRPLVMADGGEIVLVSATEERVVVRLGGACSGCPGAGYTKHAVIEPLLHEMLGPSVKVDIEP